ncbi:protein FAR-RED IMPAIRED RESPONSE 1-like [Cajanus cajan]|uniref:protein FAR-RED IMPAIRED RESPONSE 1-like n=1 Tax=Cajanus cajan TaxID=3821 RepID=UPI0010FB126E|nr:protein FAR-RED IMPAIRED RESPONSE 1-like [Cajanus cajan]
MDVKSVPEQYILKRWTKLARSVSLPNVSVRHVVEDAQLTSTQRRRDICPRLMRIVDEACRSQETYTLLSKVTDLLDKEMLEFQNKQVSNTQVNEFLSNVIEIARNNDGSTQVKGFKKKEGRKGSKRLKGWVERQLSKRKKKGDSSASQDQDLTKEINDISSQVSVTSFTSLLMAPLDGDITTLTNP